MNLSVLRISVFSLCVMLAGCSSEEASRQKTPPTSAASQDSAAPSPSFSSALDPAADTSQSHELAANDQEVTSDSAVSAILEQARQHYLSAIAAGENHDSTRSATQFEQAISMLD